MQGNNLVTLKRVNDQAIVGILKLIPGSQWFHFWPLLRNLVPVHRTAFHIITARRKLTKLTFAEMSAHFSQANSMHRHTQYCHYTTLRHFVQHGQHGPCVGSTMLLGHPTPEHVNTRLCTLKTTLFPGLYTLWGSHGQVLVATVEYPLGVSERI